MHVSRLRQADVVCNATRFLYICFMRALVVTPRNDREFKFLADLLKKLGINSSSLTEEEIEEIKTARIRVLIFCILSCHVSLRPTSYGLPQTGGVRIPLVCLAEL